MASPVGDSYSAASGATIYAGRNAPSAGPAWAANAPLNAWMEIPGTSGAGGTPIDSYSGWAKLPNARLGIAAAGGHTDGTKNSVAVIDLLVDSPAWQEVCAQSPAHTYEVAYENDGKPASCHTYYSEIYVPARSRMMRFGAYAVSITGNTHFPTVDGFNLATNTWDPAGTYANVPAGGYGQAISDAGLVLLMWGSQLYNPVTGAVTSVSVGGATTPRAPWAWDSKRGHFFGLCFGDNQEASQAAGLVAAKVTGTTMTQVAIAASAARSQFIAEIPFYAAMEYDPLNDCYLFYCGARTGTAGSVYRITPNAGLTWDMDMLPSGTGGITPVQTVASGLMNKLSYVPELNGVVMMAKKASNLYFMRTA